MTKTFLLRASAALAFVAAAPGGAASGAQPDAAPLEYALGAQPLGAALRAIGSQAGVTIIAPDELVAGRKAQTVRGRLTPLEAVRAALGGSGLEARLAGDAIAIVEMAGASDGDPIVVTGTNIRGGAPTSPIVTVTREEIERSGATSTEQLMRQVPQNFGGGVNQENFNGPGIVDITSHGAGVNLRGLGQRATLVLVNGRRLAPSGTGSFVDISLVPVSAIERVEILTDGASAIYGSDAVGGVVNFILKSRFTGVETLAQIGTTTQGGGNQLLLGANAGTDWSGGRALLSYEYRDDGEIRAGDRDFPIGQNEDLFLFPKERRHSVYGVVAQDLSDAISLEVTGTHSDRRTDRDYYTGGGLIVTNVQARSRATGLAGTMTADLGGDWRLRAEGNYFVNATRQRQDESAGQGLVNIFDTRNAMLEFAAKLDGSLLELPAGPLRVALGAQHRREEYRDYFETQVNAPTIRTGDRVIRALFGELNIPLVSAANRMPLVERLVVTAAGRLEDYDSYKATFDPKVGILWSPLEGLAFRSSYDTSFRAPLLPETTGYYNAFLYPSGLLFINPAEAPPGVSMALVGSNPAIQPERSRSWTIGGDFRPPAVPGLELTANYYAIRFTNRIAIPVQSVVVIGDPAYEPVVTRSPAEALVRDLLAGAGQVLDFSGPNFTPGGATADQVIAIVDARFNNTAVSKTRGFDVGLRYGFALGTGRMSVDLNASHILSFKDQLTAAAPAVETVDTPYRPLDWRLRGGLTWEGGPWTASAIVNYSGAYNDNRRAERVPVSSYATVDLFLGYSAGTGDPEWLRGTRLGLSVLNAFDRDPPFLAPDPGSVRGIGYDPVNASARGRSVSLQVRRTW
ncbi:TonB-dependent receptor [Allosphingosinicella indica]|nr:TonB-dependent receptor [Allosphingosinicella indica]